MLKRYSFSNEACRIALAKIVIIDEFPFTHVEGRGFVKFSHVL